MTMQAYHYHTTITKEHGLLLPRLPLEPGQEVTVTIEPTKAPFDLSSATAKVTRHFPLRGLPFEYRDPFSPAIDPDEWNMLRDDSTDPLSDPA